MLHHQPATASQTPNNISESQIISSLNSSIEDLLSKISKVQEDYEDSTRILHSRALLSVENQQLAVGDDGMKPVSTITDTSLSGSTSLIPLKQDEASTKNSKQLHKLRFFNNCSGLRGINEPAQLTLKVNSLKEIAQKQNEQHFHTLKNIRINSLFDPSIKELKASQIITGEDDQPKHECPLSLHTKEKPKSLISSTQISQFQQSLSLSQFEVGASVGSGKFGDVYLCRHRATGFLFALKKMFKSTIREYGMENQIALEIKLMYLLDHPNIVRLYGHFSDEYHIFLLMEYVEGGQLLKSLGAEEKYVARVMEPLIDAVEYLHTRQIIHRDIKPENIVLSFETPKLCDFGWAATCHRDAMRQTFCGTLDYLSPQMKDGEAYTFRVDLWSLGVLAFELITGSAPFKQQMAHWRRKGSKRDERFDWKILYPPSVSAMAESFISNLLRENPDDRASLRACRNHFFIRKYKPLQNEVRIELEI